MLFCEPNRLPRIANDDILKTNNIFMSEIKGNTRKRETYEWTLCTGPGVSVQRIPRFSSNLAAYLEDLLVNLALFIFLNTFGTLNKLHKMQTHGTSAVNLSITQNI